MTNRVWMPLLASLALLLSACGDSQEEANVLPEENAAEQTRGFSTTVTAVVS